ncbi:MFS general substrate transporter [Aspergillus taichungensis]|uniref:MFS general substrate transporter n=1 Tax=Aspergillus taichungensis TaxID=482145 RepID=A0A2J5HXR7_9EURO|nr:MFS general substrate transporter [Aspergillus taichungensis]
MAYLNNAAAGDLAICWIFGIYVFVSYFCGILIGPIFDARGQRGLMLIGSVFLLIGTFTLGLCSEYYQFIFAFSVLSGIGNSFLFTPAMGAISHWFHVRRGEASGFAFTGSGFGGVLFPLIIQSLLPQVGWAWSTRIVGFVFLLLCALGVILCRSRLPPKRGAATSWRDMVPDPRIFKDGTGAMTVTTAGIFLLEWAYFIPVTYIPSYYLIRQGLLEGGSVSGAAAFAYRLLAILNAVSCFGRYLIGYIADKKGRYNTMIVSNLVCLAAVMGLWLPDALADTPPNKALLITFVVVFGFASGSNISLMPVCVGQLCATHDYGRYYASAYTVASIGCLTGIPIAGNLITSTGGGRRGYWGVILFAGLSYVTAFACFVWVRIRVKGWNMRTVW